MSQCYVYHQGSTPLNGAENVVYDDMEGGEEVH
jgi:hypothetical protein